MTMQTNEPLGVLRERRKQLAARIPTDNDNPQRRDFNQTRRMSAKQAERFAGNLSRFMQQWDLSAKDLARLVGVSAPTVRDWLACRRRPYGVYLRETASALGLDNEFPLLDRELSYAEIEALLPAALKGGCRMAVVEAFWDAVEAISGTAGRKAIKDRQALKTALLCFIDNGRSHWGYLLEDVMRTLAFMHDLAKERAAEAEVALAAKRRAS